MKQLTILNILLLITILVSCEKSNNHNNGVNGEGTVVYKINYTKENSYKDKLLLPKETNLFFKGSNATFITTSMGMVQMVNLLDTKNKKFTSLLLNTIGTNYAFTETPEDVKLQESNPELKFETTNEIKTIAGLECNKAIVTDVTNKKKYDVYYYKKIKVYLGDSPYKDFNYLLMDYQDTRFGVQMHLEATKVNFNPIDTSMLTVHGDFNWVNKKTFVSIVESMSSTL